MFCTRRASGSDAHPFHRIWWTMKKNAWKKDAHPGENGESDADKNRGWRVMKEEDIHNPGC